VSRAASQGGTEHPTKQHLASQAAGRQSSGVAARSGAEQHREWHQLVVAPCLSDSPSKGPARQQDAHRSSLGWQLTAGSLLSVSCASARLSRRLSSLPYPPPAFFSRAGRRPTSAPTRSPGGTKRLVVAQVPAHAASGSQPSSQYQLWQLAAAAAPAAPAARAAPPPSRSARPSMYSLAAAAAAAAAGAGAYPSLACRPARHAA
jgi:hypothetical protein